MILNVDVQPKAVQTLNSLQCLRGIAAVLVVLAHSGVTFQQRYHTWVFPAFVHGGVVGVDIFFCLSGFIMYYTTAADFGVPRAWFGFLCRRVFRIYPVYWVATAIALLIGWWVPHVRSPHPLSATYLLRSLALLPGNDSPVVWQGWTLVHEMRFYATFAVLLCLPRRPAFWGMGGWSLGSAVVLGLSYFAPTVLNDSLMARAANYFFHPASLEFVLGWVAAWIVRHRATARWLDPAALALGVISTGILMEFSSSLAGFTKYWTVTLFMLPSFSLILGAALSERRFAPRLPALGVSLGEASYSIYLSHVLVLELMVHFLPAALDPAWLPWLGWLVALGTVVAGWLFYLVVERPLLRRSRGWAAWLTGATRSRSTPASGAPAGSA